MQASAVLVLVLSSLCGCAGCERGAPGPPITAASGDRLLDASPAKPEASVVTDAVVVTADAGISLPPLDTTCAVDADCEAVAVEISGKYACCPSCGTTIGNVAWAASVRAICAKTGMPSTCYPLACPMGPMHARCDAGRCVAKM